MNSPLQTVWDKPILLFFGFWSLSLMVEFTSALIFRTKYEIYNIKDFRLGHF